MTASKKTGKGSKGVSRRARASISALPTTTGKNAVSKGRSNGESTPRAQSRSSPAPYHTLSCPFSRRVRGKLDADYISIATLSGLSEVPYTALRQWLSGHRGLSLDKLARVYRALGLKP